MISATIKVIVWVCHVLMWAAYTHSTGKLDKMICTFWMYTVLGSVFVLSAAQNTCPTSWFTSEFTIVSDRVISAATGEGLLDDPNGTYFRDVLGFTERQIAAELVTIRDYFNTTFGLDFPDLDSDGEAHFESATLSYFRVPFTHFVTVNRWIANGNTRSRCIDTFNGGVRVTFAAGSTQVLRGTYGGATGRTVVRGEDLLYGYYSINACPQQPLLIQYQSQIPGRQTADRYVVNDNRLYHPQLGTGFEIVVFRVEPNYNNDPSLLRSRFYATLFFPNITPIIGLN